MTYSAPSVPATGLRLHFNENTGGCSPAVLAALQSITPTDTAFYPDYGPVTSAAERYFGVPVGWVQLTNGLDEGLHVAAQAAARSRMDAEPKAAPNAAAIIVEPAFEMYAACADATGLRDIHIAPDVDFTFPLQRILDAATPDVRLIYLTDPNNPTGLAIPPGAVEALAAARPEAVVLLDEAYAEFSGRTMIGPLLERYRNVIVGRTFAKAHGLAALRAGALIAHPDALAPLRRLLPPYSLNICAVRALEAAFADRGYLDAYVAQAVASKQLIYGFCDARGIRYWPSEANFVLLRLGPDADVVTSALAARGIYIRNKSSAPGCAGCVRITAGLVEHTRSCLAALEDILASRNR
jgi:histidinol-phosphate aminotransferase